MVLLEDRVVEEDHHPVAGEVLEGAAVLDDRVAHHAVVLARGRPSSSSGIGLLRERGEAPQVAEGDRDLPPMAGEQCSPSGDEIERRRPAATGSGSSSARWRSIVAVSARCCSRCSTLEVAQPLRGERRTEPRLEDARIDRLREVVGGAELDAADDAVELLDARHDDDDRQMRAVASSAFIAASVS